MPIPVGTDTSQGTVTPIKKKKKKGYGVTFVDNRAPSEIRTANFLTAWSQSFPGSVPTPKTTRDFVDNHAGISEGTVDEYATIMHPAVLAGVKPGADYTDESVTKWILKSAGLDTAPESQPRDPLEGLWGQPQPYAGNLQAHSQGSGRVKGHQGQQAAALGNTQGADQRELTSRNPGDLRARYNDDPSRVIEHKALGIDWVNELAKRHKWGDYSPEAQHFLETQTGQMPVNAQEFRATAQRDADRALKTAQAMVKRSPGNLAAAQRYYENQISEINSRSTIHQMGQMERGETKQAFVDAATTNSRLNLYLQGVMPEGLKPLGKAGEQTATPNSIKGLGAPKVNQKGYENAWQWTPASQKALEISQDGRALVIAQLATPGSAKSTAALDYLATRGYVSAGLTDEAKIAALASGDIATISDPAKREDMRAILAALGSKPGADVGKGDLMFRMYLAGANPNMSPMQVAKEFSDLSPENHLFLPKNVADLVAKYDSADSKQMIAHVLGSAVKITGEGVKDLHIDDVGHWTKAAFWGIAHAGGTVNDAARSTLLKVPGGKEAWDIFINTPNPANMMGMTPLMKKVATSAPVKSAAWAGVKGAGHGLNEAYQWTHDTGEIYLSTIFVEGKHVGETLSKPLHGDWGGFGSDIKTSFDAHLSPAGAVALYTQLSPIGPVSQVYASGTVAAQVRWFGADPSTIQARMAALGNDLVSVRPLDERQQLRMRLLNDSQHLYTTGVTLTALNALRGGKALTGPIGGDPANPTYDQLFAQLGNKQYLEPTYNFRSSGEVFVGDILGGDPGGKDKLFADAFTIAVNCGIDVGSDAAIGALAAAAKVAALTRLATGADATHAAAYASAVAAAGEDADLLKAAEALRKNHVAMESVASMLAKADSKNKVWQLYKYMDRKLIKLLADAKTPEEVKVLLSENKELIGHDILPDAADYFRYRAITAIDRGIKTGEVPGYWDRFFMKMTDPGMKAPNAVPEYVESEMRAAGMPEKAIDAQLSRILSIDVEDEDAAQQIGKIAREIEEGIIKHHVRLRAADIEGGIPNERLIKLTHEKWDKVIYMTADEARYTDKITHVEGPNYRWSRDKSIVDSETTAAVDEAGKPIPTKTSASRTPRPAATSDHPLTMQYIDSLHDGSKIEDTAGKRYTIHRKGRKVWAEADDGSVTTIRFSNKKVPTRSGSKFISETRRVPSTRHASRVAELHPTAYFQETGKVGEYTALRKGAGEGSRRMHSDAKVLKEGTSEFRKVYGNKSAVLKDAPLGAPENYSKFEAIANAKKAGYDAVEFADGSTVIVNGAKFPGSQSAKNALDYADITVSDAIKRGMITESQAEDKHFLNQWEYYNAWNAKLARARHTRWTKEEASGLNRSYNPDALGDLSKAFDVNMAEAVVSDYITANVLKDTLASEPLKAVIGKAVAQFDVKTNDLTKSLSSLNDTLNRLGAVTARKVEKEAKGFAVRGKAQMLDVSAHSGDAREAVGALIDKGWTPLFRGVRPLPAQEVGDVNAATQDLAAQAEDFFAPTGFKNDSIGGGGAVYTTVAGEGDETGDIAAAAAKVYGGDRGAGVIMISPDARGMAYEDLMQIMYGEPGGSITVVVGNERQVHRTGQIPDLIRKMNNLVEVVPDSRGGATLRAIAKPLADTKMTAEELAANVRARRDLEPLLDAVDKMLARRAENPVEVVTDSQAALRRGLRGEAGLEPTIPVLERSPEYGVFAEEKRVAHGLAGKQTVELPDGTTVEMDAKDAISYELQQRVPADQTWDEYYQTPHGHTPTTGRATPGRGELTSTMPGEKPKVIQKAIKPKGPKGGNLRRQSKKTYQELAEGYTYEVRRKNKKVQSFYNDLVDEMWNRGTKGNVAKDSASADTRTKVDAENLVMSELEKDPTRTVYVRRWVDAKNGKHVKVSWDKPIKGKDVESMTAAELSAALQPEMGVKSGAIDAYMSRVERELQAGMHPSQQGDILAEKVAVGEGTLSPGFNDAGEMVGKARPDVVVNLENTKTIDQLEKEQETILKAMQEQGATRSEALKQWSESDLPAIKDRRIALENAYREGDPRVRLPRRGTKGWAEEWVSTQLDPILQAKRKDAATLISQDAATELTQLVRQHLELLPHAGERDAVRVAQSQYLLRRWGFVGAQSEKDVLQKQNLMLHELGYVRDDLSIKQAKIAELSAQITPDARTAVDPAEAERIGQALYDQINMSQDPAEFLASKGFDYTDVSPAATRLPIDDPAGAAYARSLRIRVQGERDYESIMALRGEVPPAESARQATYRMVVNRDTLRYTRETDLALDSQKADMVGKRIAATERDIRASQAQAARDLDNLLSSTADEYKKDVVSLFQAALSKTVGRQTSGRDELLSFLTDNPKLHAAAEKRFNELTDRIALVLGPDSVAPEVERQRVMEELRVEMHEANDQLKQMHEHPEQFMRSAPQWLHQQSFWYSPQIHAGTLAKFHMGATTRGWEIVQQTRLGGYLPSIDDATRLYRTLVLSKLSTMLRIVIGDEMLRCLPEGVNPLRNHVPGFLPERMGLPLQYKKEAQAAMKISPDLHTEISTMFDLARGADHVALKPGDDHYSEAINWALGHISRDRSTKVWLEAYDEAIGAGETSADAITAATNTLTAAGHKPAAEGGFQEFLKDGRIYENLPDEVLGALNLDLPTSEQLIQQWAEGIESFNTKIINAGATDALRTGKLPKKINKDLLPMVRYRLHDNFRQGRLKNPLDRLWGVVDGFSDRLKQECFLTEYSRQRAALDAISREKVAAGGEAIPLERAQRLSTERALAYTDRIMFSTEKYVGEDISRNFVMFLPAYRQFASYWGKLALKHPLAMASVMYNLNTQIPEQVKVGPLTIRPKSAIFLTGGGSFGQGGALGIINDWGPGAAPLITVPAQYFNERYNLGLEKLPGLQFARGGNVWNAVVDRMVYAITGKSLPRPLGRPDDVWNALIVRKMKSLAIAHSADLANGTLKYSDLAGMARGEVRKDAFIEGVFKFVIPASVTWNSDQTVGGVQQILTNYETLMTTDVGRAEDLILQGKVGDSRYEGSTETQRLASLVLQYRSLPDSQRTAFIDQNPDIIPWAIGTTNPSDPDVYSALRAQYTSVTDTPENIATGWRTGAMRGQASAQQQMDNNLFTAREGQFTSYLSSTKWATEHGKDAVKKGTPIYDYYRYLFENSEGPWANGGGLKLADGRTLKFSAGSAGQALNEPDIKTAGLLEYWLGPQGMQAAFREYPTVIAERQAMKLDALKNVESIASMSTVAMSKDHWAALGIKYDDSVRQTALKLTENWMNFYDVIGKKGYKPMTTEWKALRAKTIAENNAALRANDKTKILAMGPVAKLKFLTQPQKVDWEVMAPTSSRVPVGTENAGDNRVLGGSVKITRGFSAVTGVKQGTYMSNKQAGTTLVKAFLANANGKNTKSGEYWTNVAGQNLTGQALVYYKETVRAEMWKIMLQAAGQVRDYLRTVDNSTMKSQGTSTGSKIGKYALKWMTAAQKAVRTYSPEFGQEWDALSKNSNLTNDLIDWSNS